MIIDNFYLRKKTFPLVAEVDVTTGIFWWKKTVRREVRRVFADYWHFTHNGQYTPSFLVENLARAWQAQHGDYV